MFSICPCILAYIPRSCSYTHPNVSWPVFLNFKLLHSTYGTCAAYYTTDFLNGHHRESQAFRLVHWLSYPAALGAGSPPSGRKLRWSVVASTSSCTAFSPLIEYRNRWLESVPWLWGRQGYEHDLLGDFSEDDATGDIEFLYFLYAIHPRRPNVQKHHGLLQL